MKAMSQIEIARNHEPKSYTGAIVVELDKPAPERLVMTYHDTRHELNNGDGHDRIPPGQLVFERGSTRRLIEVRGLPQDLAIQCDWSAGTPGHSVHTVGALALSGPATCPDGPTLFHVLVEIPVCDEPVSVWVRPHPLATAEAGTDYLDFSRGEQLRWAPGETMQVLAIRMVDPAGMVRAGRRLGVELYDHQGGPGTFNIRLPQVRGMCSGKALEAQPHDRAPRAGVAPAPETGGVDGVTGLPFAVAGLDYAPFDPATVTTSAGEDGSDGFDFQIKILPNEDRRTPRVLVLGIRDPATGEVTGQAHTIIPAYAPVGRQ